LQLNACLHFANAELSRDGFGGPLIIAREHDHFDAKLLKIFDRIRRRFLDRIGDGKNANSTPIDTHKHRRLPLCLKLSGLFFEFFDIANFLGF